MSIHPLHQHLPLKPIHHLYHYCTYSSYLQSCLTIYNPFSPDPPPKLPFPNRNLPILTFRNAILVITPTKPILSSPFNTQHPVLPVVSYSNASFPNIALPKPPYENLSPATSWPLTQQLLTCCFTCLPPKTLFYRITVTASHLFSSAIFLGLLLYQTQWPLHAVPIYPHTTPIQPDSNFNYFCRVNKVFSPNHRVN